MNEKTMDMTKGSIMPKLIRFALPVLLGMLFQRIYNFADVYIVGKFLGDDALAAVSIAGSGMYLLQSVMMGLTTGVSVVIAQYYGAKEEQKVTETFVTSIYVAAGSALLITIIGVIGAKPLLCALQTSDDLMQDAWVYLVTIFAGSIGTMLYNWISAVLRSLGNSVVPLIFLVISSALNIVLDILFIAGIPMGVAGAALATVLAQVISGVLCLLYAFKILPMLRLSKEKMHMDTGIAKLILIYGVPTGLQMSIISISDMTLQAMINTYGTALVVAYGVSTKVEGLGWQMADAIGTSLGTFVGQNVGAGNPDRVKKGVRCAYLMDIICYGIFCPVIWFFASPIMQAFTQNTDAIRCGIEYIRIFSGFFVIGGFLVIYHNILRAAGDVKVTVLMGVSEVITRIGFTFLFSACFGYYGLWWVSPLTWCCAALVGAVRYYSGKWMGKVKIS
ncbi:MATE family efflux transporter [Roseburia sp. BX1005]|uniref:Probable multidrug resistance protein NorM n=1 Tax=Roseburia zhanii TaxID=2763064 RepID=A0A923RV63_9FIRM|nr:MATE family efflux transporter [Roseburia zhanii]MBC5713934.1 MATE family efflux transporter [Roseburia zhanii]